MNLNECHVLVECGLLDEATRIISQFQEGNNQLKDCKHLDLHHDRDFSITICADINANSLNSE